MAESFTSILARLLAGDDTNLTGPKLSRTEAVTLTEACVALESLEAADNPAHGEIVLTASAETSVATVDTPLKVAGTTTLGVGITQRQFDMPAVNRLRYTGTETRSVHVQVALSLIAASNNKVFNLHVALNGVVVAGSEQQRKISTGADVGTMHLQTFVDMDEDDYIELWVENTTDDTNLTVTHLNLIAVGLPTT